MIKLKNITKKEQTDAAEKLEKIAKFDALKTKFTDFAKKEGFAGLEDLIEFFIDSEAESAPEAPAKGKKAGKAPKAKAGKGKKKYQQYSTEVAEKIKKLRDAGETWDKVKEETGVDYQTGTKWLKRVEKEQKAK